MRVWSCLWWLLPVVSSAREEKRDIFVNYVLLLANRGGHFLVSASFWLPSAWNNPKWNSGGPLGGTLQPFRIYRKTMLSTTSPTQTLWVWLFKPEMVTTGKPQPQERASWNGWGVIGCPQWERMLDHSESRHAERQKVHISNVTFKIVANRTQRGFVFSFLFWSVTWSYDVSNDKSKTIY